MSPQSALLGWLLSALAACATGPTAPAAPRTPDEELIIIETDPGGPACGRCDTFKLTASSTGRVWIERGYWAGEYDIWQVRRRRTRVARARVAALREHLRPLRPRGELLLDRPERCATFEDDVGGVRVEWRGGGADSLLRYNFGCDGDTRRAMADTLRIAPRPLGIHGLATLPGYRERRP
ncbi:MAG TPA: hypothetical protein VF603_09200 [Allosphingosinicella sp.]